MPSWSPWAPAPTERADAFADEWDIPRRHGDYDDLAADDDVDVVYVATPQSRHADDACRYLDAGKHVLCEKPMAMTEAEVLRMTASAHLAERFLMEAIWSRFLPSYVTLWELLLQGRIGEPQFVEADFGFRMPVDPAHRLFDPARGGGALLDLGVYPLQLASFVLGAPDGVAASGHVGETDVDETVAATLHHPGGRLAVAKASIRVNLACTARIVGHRGQHRAARLHALPRRPHRPGRLQPGRGASRPPSTVRACATRSTRSTAASPRACARARS